MEEMKETAPTEAVGWVVLAARRPKRISRSRPRSLAGLVLSLEEKKTGKAG